MSVLYVVKPGARIGKGGGRVQVSKSGRILASLPVAEVERVVVLGPASITPACVQLLLRQGIPTVFAGMSGGYQGMLSSAAAPVSRLLRQIQWCRDVPGGEAARQIVRVKLIQQRNLLLRYRRNHGVDLVQGDEMEGLVQRVDAMNTAAGLMGLEGRGSVLYFAALSLCLPEASLFNGRSRRPPKDPVNAALSLGYIMLAGEVQTHLIAQGLHPWLGVLHETQDRRPALAMDVLELFRQPVVDRLVLRLFNRRQLTADDFTWGGDSRGMRFSPAGLQCMLQAYEEVMTDGNGRKAIEECVTALRRAVDGNEPWMPHACKM